MNSRMVYLTAGCLLLPTFSMVSLAAPTPPPPPPKIRAVLKGHKGAVTSLAFSPNGKLLASGSMDKTVKLWDVESGKNIATLAGHTESVHSVAFSPNGKVLASSGMEDGLRLWEVPSGKTVTVSKERRRYDVTLVFSRDSKTVFNGVFWDIVTRKIRKNAKGEVSPEGLVVLQSCPYDAKGQLLAIVWVLGSRSNNKIWDLLANKALRTLEAPETGDFSQCSAFRPDGKVLASAGECLCLWDVATGKLLGNYKRPGDRTTALMYSPDGTILAAAWRRLPENKAGHFRGLIALLDAATGKELANLDGHDYAIQCIAFSPVGKLLASADGGLGVIKLWDVRGVKALKKE